MILSTELFEIRVCYIHKIIHFEKLKECKPNRIKCNFNGPYKEIVAL